MARTLYQANDTDIELAVTDRYGNAVTSIVFDATLLDQNGDPVGGATDLATSFDTTLQLLIVTIPGSVTADAPVGPGYTLQLPATGDYAGHVSLTIPCQVAVRGQS